MKTHYVVYGAGAVGGVIGARLHLAGLPVTLVARGAHLAAIRTAGLTLDAADGPHVIDAPATDTAADVAWTDDTVVVLAVKTQHTAAAVADLADHAPASVAVVCAQNGVVNEQAVLRRFERTYGITVMLPAIHLEPGVVVQNCHPTPGLLDVGRFPAGADETTEQVAADLRSAGFSSVARSNIMAWKYRKLVTNAVADVSSVLPDEAGALEPAVRREAEAALAAAGIGVVSLADDRDRRGNELRFRPHLDGPNSLAQSLQRGESGLEVDYRAGEIVLLGRLHGVPTPANERVQRAAHALLKASQTR